LVKSIEQGLHVGEAVCGLGVGVGVGAMVLVAEVGGGGAVIARTFRFTY
jgi:hypothetical protein